MDGIKHEQDLVLDHTGRIATLEEAVKRLPIIEKKLDSNLYLLLIAIASVIIDMAATHFHILGL